MAETVEVAASQPRLPPLYIGDEIVEDGERALISQLRRDLAEARCDAVLFANFFPDAAPSRQVDLLVHTRFRTAAVEIKALNPRCPVEGGRNGHWTQTRGSSVVDLGSNFGTQARSCRFAVTDSMRKLYRSGRVGGSAEDFRPFVDGVLTFWEAIPDGSSFELPNHVTAGGYSDLLKRVLSPGPRVPWSVTGWERYATSHNLFQVTEDLDLESGSAGSSDLSDYCDNVRAMLTHALGAYVELNVHDARGAVVSLPELTGRATEGERIGFIGPSGAGKTLVATHLALQRCDLGRVVIWARAADYESNAFARLVARAMSPYSARKWRELTDSAKAAGRGVTLVLDALEDCPRELRSQLLERSAGFASAFGAELIVTAQTPDGLEQPLRATVLSIPSPSVDERAQILSAHGCTRPELVSSQFCTPYELALAAECETDLGPDATVSDLHAALIMQLAPTEAERSGLRTLAAHFHARTRSSLPLYDSTQLLSAASSTTDGQIDLTLRSPLLVRRGQRIGFRHELIERHLAGDALVRNCTDASSLSLELLRPINASLRGEAVAAIPDKRTSAAVLLDLDDPRLVYRALSGGFGPEVAALIEEDVRRALHRAAEVTTSARATFEPGRPSRWMLAEPLPRREVCLLAAAGFALQDGLMFDEAMAVVDAADRLCAETGKSMREHGIDDPASHIVAATYTQFASVADDGLPASHIARTFELGSMTLRYGTQRSGAPSAASIQAGADAESWGRLYFAVLALRPDRDDDVRVLPDLLAAAWRAGGTHLMLEAIEATRRFAGAAEPSRSRIVAAVEALTTDDPWLASSITETFAALGLLEPLWSLDDVRQELDSVIRRHASPEAWVAADALYCRQYDPVAIVGPWGEGIAELGPEDTCRFLTMCVLGADLAVDIHLPAVVHELNGLLPFGDPQVDQAAAAALERLLTSSDFGFMPSQTRSAAAAAVTGWARLGHRTLPTGRIGSDGVDASHASYTVLLARACVEIGGDDPPPLSELLPGGADLTVQVLGWLEDASRIPLTMHSNVLREVLTAWPEDWTVRLLEALRILGPNPQTAEAPVQPMGPTLIRSLGVVGDMATIEHLRPFANDADIGSEVVAAMERIDRRLNR